jgi:hypothetical protein
VFRFSSYILPIILPFQSWTSGIAANTPSEVWRDVSHGGGDAPVFLRGPKQSDESQRHLFLFIGKNLRHCCTLKRPRICSGETQAAGAPQRLSRDGVSRRMAVLFLTISSDAQLFQQQRF